MTNKMERSAGIILFRERAGKREYVLLKYHHKNIFWSFAKGIIEKNETEKETALREVQEETGLRKIKLIPWFKEKTNYFKTVDGKKIEKEVIWFLGKVEDKVDGKVSWEHEELGWFSYTEASKKIKFKNDQELLKKAEKFTSKSHTQSA